MAAPRKPLSTRGHVHQHLVHCPVTAELAAGQHSSLPVFSDPQGAPGDQDRVRSSSVSPAPHLVRATQQGLHKYWLHTELSWEMEDSKQGVTNTQGKIKIW